MVEFWIYLESRIGRISLRLAYGVSEKNEKKVVPIFLSKQLE